MMTKVNITKLANSFYQIDDNAVSANDYLDGLAQFIDFQSEAFSSATAGNGSGRRSVLIFFSNDTELAKFEALISTLSADHSAKPSDVTVYIRSADRVEVWFTVYLDELDPRKNIERPLSPLGTNPAQTLEQAAFIASRTRSTYVVRTSPEMVEKVGVFL